MARKKAGRSRAAEVLPSVLLPETQRVLRLALRDGDRLIPPKDEGEVDAKRYAELRAWLKTQPHTAECRCPRCQH